MLANNLEAVLANNLEAVLANSLETVLANSLEAVLANSCEYKTPHFANDHSNLVHPEGNLLGAILEDGADEVGRQLHSHDQLLAPTVAQNSMAEEMLWYISGPETTPEP